MLSYKTTVVLALNKETREEVGRFLVKGNNLFTVANRACTAETCGTSEGQETPVSIDCSYLSKDSCIVWQSPPPPSKRELPLARATPCAMFRWCSCPCVDVKVVRQMYSSRLPLLG